MYIAYSREGNTGVEFLLVNHQCGLSIEDIARKDVPKGRPYLFVQPSDLPQSDEYREAWTMDFSEPDGVGMGADDWLKSKGLYIE